MGLLTMSGSFLWVNALFPPVLAGAFFGTKAYLASEYADQLVAMYGVPVADVPMVVAVCLHDRRGKHAFKVAPSWARSLLW